MDVEELPPRLHGPAPSPVTHAYPHINKPMLHHKHRWSTRLILAAVAITLGSSIPTGYNIGVINEESHVIDDWAKSSMVLEHHADLGINQRDFKHILNLGGIVGSIVALWLVDHLGRKNSIIFSNFMSLFAGILCLVAPSTNSVEVLFSGRLIYGISSGVVTSIAPMYLVELSPLRLKGAMGAVFALGLSIGILCAHGLGLPSILGTADYWHILLAFNGVFILLSWLLLMFLPESPRYLYSVKGMKQSAILELSSLRGVTLKQAEIELKDHNAPIGDSWTLKRLLSNRDLLIQEAVLCALMFGHQFSGIAYVLSTGDFTDIDLSNMNADVGGLASVIHCGVMVVMLYFINLCQRKRLIVLSCALCSVSLILVAASLTFNNVTDWMPIVSEGCLLLYVAAFSLGLQSIPFFLGAELFDVGPRSVAMALASAVFWTARFGIIVAVPLLNNELEQYIYVFFAVITAVVGVFTQCCLSETKPNLKRKPLPLPPTAPKRVSFMDMDE